MLFLSLFNAWADIPLGQQIEHAAHIDIPPDGFSALTDILPQVLPAVIPAEPTQGGGGSGGCFLEYAYDIDNLWVGVNVDSASLIPQNNYLTLNADIAISVNDSADPFAIILEAVCTTSDCSGYVTPFPANIQARVDLALVDLDGDGRQEIDASISGLEVSYDVTGDNVTLDCAVGWILGSLNSIGVDVYSFVLDRVYPLIEAEIYEELPELELIIEEAFVNAIISEEIELGDGTLMIDLYPNSLVIQNEGLRMVFSGSTTTEEASECVAAYDTLASKETTAASNALGDLAVDAALGISLSDDFVNQALYNVWRSGLLCQRIDQDTFALDTSILNLLTNEAFIELFPESEPMVLQIDPRVSPTLNMDVEDDVGIHVEEMGLEFYAELDFRQARILSVDIETDLGLNLPFDANTGEIRGEINIDSERISSTVQHNEFVPSASSDIETNFAEQIASVLNLIDLDSLTGDLQFALPSVRGIGITEINTSGNGVNQEDLGLFVAIGPVPYVGGCSSEDSGCTTTGHTKGRNILFVMALVLGCLRRRSNRID